MPCPKRYQAALQETTITDDGVKMYTWRAVRRQHLRMLRKQTRTIVLFMALIEALRVGVVDIVYAGKNGTKAPGPEDYGIAYNVGYFISWLYMCLFAILFVPLFSWWLPKLSSDDASKPSKTEKVAQILFKLNMILLPICVGLSLVQHIYYVLSALVYVDGHPVEGRKLPANTRKNWLVRLLLLGGILISITLGRGVFSVLGEMDLARVKPLEYLVIVLPIQVNLGLLLGSGVQFKIEQRAAKKQVKIRDAEAVRYPEEKQALLEPQVAPTAAYHY